MKSQLKLMSLSIEHSPQLPKAQAMAYEENVGKSWDKPYDPQFGYSGQTKEGREVFRNVTSGWEQDLPAGKKSKKSGSKQAQAKMALT